MNSPYFTEEHEIFRDTVRQFVKKEILPYASQWEEQGHLPRSLWEKMGQAGLLGIPFPEECGGAGADIFYSIVLLEELAGSLLAGLTAAVSVHMFIAPVHLLKFGSKALKQAYLPDIIAGKKIGALAVTEPNAGSDVASIQTRAIRHNDVYRVTGAKTFITNGVHGDFITTAVKTDPEAGSDGITLLLIDRNLKGVSARPLQKIGWHCSDTAEITFDDVEVPEENRIGEENLGFYYLMDAFQMERLVAAVLAVAGAQKTLDLAIEYMNQRHVFGRPLTRFQALRHRMADLATEIAAARQLTYATAWLLHQQQPAIQECSMAKLFATEVAKKVADECLQVFGGYGYMEEYPIARIYRDARVGTIAGGTSEIMREIISRILIDREDFAGGQEKLHHSQQATETPQSARELLMTLPKRYRPEKDPDYQTVIHFQLKGKDGGKFSVIIENQQCRVQEGWVGEARCVVETKSDTYVKIETGRMNPQMAFALRKIKISNVPELMKFTQMFRRLKKK